MLLPGSYLATSLFVGPLILLVKLEISSWGSAPVASSVLDEISLACVLSLLRISVRASASSQVSSQRARAWHYSGVPSGQIAPFLTEPPPSPSPFPYPAPLLGLQTALVARLHHIESPPLLYPYSLESSGSFLLLMMPPLELQGLPPVITVRASSASPVVTPIKDVVNSFIL